MRRLVDTDTLEEARRRIAALLDAHAEWFCTETPAARSLTTLAQNNASHLQSDAAASSSGATFAMRKGEWEVEAARGALVLSLPTERGMRSWRVVAWDEAGGHLLFQAARRMGRERATLELIPRAASSDAKAIVAAARRAASERLAVAACAMLAGARPLRVGLSRGARRGEPGRYARIVLETKRERIALAAPVVASGAHDTDAFLASTLLWFARLGERRRDARPLRLWLAVAPDIAHATATRLALLHDELRRALSLYELDAALLSTDKADELQETTAASETSAPTHAFKHVDESQTLKRLDVPDLNTVVASSAPRFSLPTETPLSHRAREIIALAPEAIDVVRARHGETLRFHGLAFARVRRVLEHEEVWFGVDGAPQRQLLGDANRHELLKLVGELSAHRRAAATDVRHAFRRAAPEAWLESMLRRDISQLDPALILSPLHAQFRTARDAHAGAARPVDLLALRRDGRLVVIELKIAEDAALPLQGADYWRRVETQRLRGRLRRARLFGDMEIADEPPLVYLVAPLLSFHRDTNALARAINPRIEIFRFDLNEDWRAGIRVARRESLRV
ncbi:MAG TPA: hypothetical protein VF666_16525 [Pyrinomonadaceae bacterium]|jgi:hypothetical protein